MSVFAATLAFAWIQISGPSDGARLHPTQRGWQEAGVMVIPLNETGQGLQAEDIVLAIDGKSMPSMLRALFRPGETQQRAMIGEQRIYTVLREGQIKTVPVALSRFYLDIILQNYWGAILTTVIFQIIVTFIFVRRPSDPAAVILLLYGWSFSSSIYTWSLGLQPADLLDPAAFWSNVVSGAWVLTLASVLHFALIFPHPHPMARRWRAVVPLSYALAYGIYFTWIGVSMLRSNSMLEAMSAKATAELFIGLIYLSITVLVQLSGYRSNPVAAERKKIRWVIFGGFVSGAALVVLWVLPHLILGGPIISPNLLALTFLPVPVTMAIAILRHQLFDIDVIIRRTLIYTLLTALLVLVYFASVVVLQGTIQAINAGESPQLVTILSTLAIAAIFTPLRQRVQDFIDRRFYRKKYDARQILEDFSSSLRDEIDLDQLGERLVAVVEESIQPERVFLWLRGEWETGRRGERETGRVGD